MAQYLEYCDAHSSVCPDVSFGDLMPPAPAESEIQALYAELSALLKVIYEKSWGMIRAQRLPELARVAVIRRRIHEIEHPAPEASHVD
jgi:hypothetical protein